MEPEGLIARAVMPPQSARRQVDASVFADLAQASAILVAVSGGPDSMALLGLLAEWAREHAAAPKIYAATVDHGLRAGSAAEAAVVADIAASLRVPHAVLPWTGPKPLASLQERARHARYALLVEHAERVGASLLLTAHHADDQAETVLMRLGRGSGLRGLAGMRREQALAPAVTLVRPFLAIPKRVLETECRRLKLPYVDDPSNADTSFLRNRLRADADKAVHLGLDRTALTRLARRMGRAEEALAAETTRVASVIDAHVLAGVWRADLSRQVNVAPEIVTRILERAIAEVARAKADTPGSRHAPHLRLDRLETLADAVLDARRAGLELRVTLGGTRVIVARDGMVEVGPEAPRRRGMRLEAKMPVSPEACPAFLQAGPGRGAAPRLHLARARAKPTLAERS